MNTPFEDIARQVYTRFSLSRAAQYHREIIVVMKQCLAKDSNCVDVGAYRGHVLREALKISPDGEHYAFEPLPDQHQYLIKRFPKAKTYGLALSDVVGEAIFHHVLSRPTYSGLREILYPTPYEQIEVIKVQMDLLDNIIPQELPIQFMKIVVQGAELLVLRGSVKTIRRSKPIIVFTYGSVNSSRYGTSSEDVYDFLAKECELRVSLMARWIKHRAPLSRREFIDEVYQQRNHYFIAYDLR